MNKNKEILNVLEENEKFKVIRLFEEIVYANNRDEAIKKVKNLNRNLKEIRVIEGKNYSFRHRWGLAVLK